MNKQIKRIIACLIFFGIAIYSCPAHGNSLADTVVIKNYLNQSIDYSVINPDSALYCSNKALELARKIQDPKFVSFALQSAGHRYIRLENFGKATDVFLEALKIEETSKNNSRIADLSDDMGYIYYLMERFPAALDYYSSALKIYANDQDTTGIAKVLSHIGNLHNSRRYCETRSEEQQKTDFETAVDYYMQSLDLSTKINNTDGIINCYVNLANAYQKLGKTNEAIKYLDLALNHYKSVNDIDGITSCLYNFGMLYTKIKEYNKAIDYYNRCVDLAEKYNQKSGIQFLYEQMAHTYELNEQFDNSLKYYKKYMTLRDSIYNSEKSKQIFELETKYQTQKKEFEIQTLKFQKKKKNYFITILAFLLLTIILSAWYLIRRNRHRRIMAEQSNIINAQKIKELEQEKLLVATQSVLSGEETERRRLARDLHDGLGGLLSGIKLKLTNMKGNFILDESGKSDFENALEMLDNSVRELRRVAHNMMPEALIKFGLKDALDDFCSALNQLKGVKLVYRFYGEHQRVDQNIEIALYRIAQELINNALKHSGATEILVDLIQDNDRISLTVQDNGKGFDLSAAEAGKGVGINSIKSRVSALNGNFEINTSPGTGAEISVEFSTSGSSKNQ